jgi:ATP-binding cassette subfamily F protein 3
MIRLHDVTLARGGNVLLDAATWHLRPGARVGVVGRNGSGKTTLLYALTGRLLPEGGRIEVRPGLRIGYLAQEAVSGSTRTVWEEARAAMTRMAALRERLEAAEAAAGRGDADGAERLDAALEAWRAAGGFREDEKVGEVLHGLGFRPEEWHVRCDTLSGGWQMRVGLARVLLSEPDLVLLDEPTNHLDLLARGWLAKFLAAAPFSVALVSHDRHLLDAVVDEIVEVRAKKLHTFKGGVGDWLRERELRIDQQETERARQLEEIEKLSSFVDRFKAKATKAAQARSRQNRLDRIELVDEVVREKVARIRLPEAPPGAEVTVELAGARLGWPDGPDVLDGVDLELARGMRVAVLGANGSGKSTLLSALAGTLPLRSGRRKVGDRVRIGVFTQDLAAELPKDRSGLDVLAEAMPLVTPERHRAVLGALGLVKDAAVRPIGELSGGERARVALGALVTRPSACLLLDEPTNHLDVETVEVLADALCAFDGAVFLVSHDRHLVERVATHVLRVEHGRAEISIGVEPEDFELTPRRRTAAAATGAADEHAERKKRARQNEKSRRRIGQIESRITEIDAKLTALDDQMVAHATDHVKVRALTSEHDALTAEQEALFAEWEALEAGQ